MQPNSITPLRVGWDIGGANLKVALLAADGTLQQTLQLACPLWKGLDQLEIAVLSALKQFDVEAITVRHAVTMTGELVDLFQSRHQGVVEIATLFTQIVGSQAGFYVAHTNKASSRFVPLIDVSQYSRLIASANWHASASLIATLQPQALLVDIGGTTTDIVPIVDGMVADVGFSDAQRMQQDSLVYTGVVRTPIMALAQNLIVDGITSNVAAEYFATMADVYRLTGELPAEFDLADTADGQDKTAKASARRLARMVGHDIEDKPMQVWQDLAQNCKKLQLRRIESALAKHLQPGMSIIGAGAGAFLVKEMAERMQKSYLGLPQVLNWLEDEKISQCLPAYAVAKLLPKTFPELFKDEQ